MNRSGLCAIFFQGCLMTTMASGSAGAVAASLQGEWAGERMQVVIDGRGGRIEGDCASGRIDGPVLIGADGRFTAQGSFEAYRPGPQRADEGAGAASAHFSGEVRDGILRLAITPAGAASAQVHALQAGAQIKLIRCR